MMKMPGSSPSPGAQGNRQTRRAMKKQQQKEAVKSGKQDVPAFGAKQLFSLLAILILGLGVGSCMLLTTAA